MSAIYKSMKKLIEKKFYKTKAEAHNKIDVMYACNRLSDDEYTELTALVEEMYSND